MRKRLTAFGKALITLSLMWPIPLYFVLYPFKYKIGMPNWIGEGYWWLLPIVNLLGFLLCLCAWYRPKSKVAPTAFKGSLIYSLFKIGFWSVVIISAFAMIVLLIMAIYYLLCTEILFAWFPFAAPVAIVIALAIFGIVWMRKRKSEKGGDNA